MGMILCAGTMWSPQLVGWGRLVGSSDTRELAGFFPRHVDRTKKGKLTEEERARQTVDFWQAPAVYALYKGDAVVYVGKGTLGDRLLAHRRVDHLVGRWDAFSWVSPAPILVHRERSGRFVGLSLGQSAGAAIDSRLDSWLTEIEALGILLAKPIDNRQVPTFGRHTWLFRQRRARFPELTPELMLAELYTRMGGKEAARIR